MKCQQLQMKLLNSQNSNKNSFLFTKKKVFYRVRNKRLACFRPFENLGIGISIYIANILLFQKIEYLRPIQLNIFSFALLFQPYHQRLREYRFT